MNQYYICCPEHRLYTSFIAPALSGKLPSKARDLILNHLECDLLIISENQLDEYIDDTGWKEYGL